MAIVHLPNKLFWLDMEMTGLDVNKEVIIEVAALITDFDFKIIDTYEAIVKQPQKYLDAMDDWNKSHHKDSGLTAKVPQGMEPEDVENDLMMLASQHFSSNHGKPILAGNSITQDRLFIDKYFTKFSSILHYRMLDVSSWKIIFNSKLGLKYQKKNSHRALDDIRESVAELQFYISHFDPKKHK